jgi:O-antigen ligase
MICIASAIFTKFSWRKLLLILAAALLLAVTSAVLTTIYGERNALTWERIILLLTTENYASKEDLSRFSALPTVSREFLNTFPQKLFGLGLGNCDTSSFAICNTPFFKRYSDLHYNWFSSSFLLLETGYFGLVLFLLFFILCFALALRRKKQGGNQLFCQLSIIMSLICIVLTFYNCSLRMDVAYLAYFTLALPFINRKQTT